MRNMGIVFLIHGALFTVFPGSAAAHHSFAAYYDVTNSLEITGVVVDFQFINPHSFLVVDVTQEDGSVERWEVESNSANTLRSRGWDENTFRLGEVITVSGFPHRKNIPQMDGREFVRADGTTLGKEQERSLQSLEDVYRPNPKAHGIAGRWLGSYLYPKPDGAAGSRLPLTPAGLEAWENYDPERSPIVTCEPMNIPTLFYVGDYLLDIRFNGQEVVIHHELYDVTRTVTLNSPPRAQEPSGWFGVAVGRMENEDLVIESSEFPPSRWGLAVEVLANGNGGDVPSSAEKRVLERYSISENGKTLALKYTVEDPVYLTEPYSDQREWTRLADDAPLHPFDCDPDSAARFTGLAFEREPGQEQPNGNVSSQ